MKKNNNLDYKLLFFFKLINQLINLKINYPSKINIIYLIKNE